MLTRFKLTRRNDAVPFHFFAGSFPMKRPMLFATALVFFCLFASLYSTQARSTIGTTILNTSQETTSQPADLSEKIRLLSSANPVERAKAACQIGAMGKRAEQAIPGLIQ